MRHEDSNFVRGSLAHGGEPPALREPRSLEHAKDDVGIADVDC